MVLLHEPGYWLIFWRYHARLGVVVPLLLMMSLRPGVRGGDAGRSQAPIGQH
jgi:hypothetical protein